MARTAFTTSPGAHGQQRKFVNPTGGFVGANVFGPGGEPTAISVEPGGEVWLTEEEERMTAEAPRLAQDNPFVKQWDEPVDFDSFGEATRHVTRSGILVLTDAPPRPVASDRFIPERGSADDLRATREAMEGLSQPEYSVEQLRAMLAEKEAAEPKEETVKGADVPEPTQPAPQGQPSPDEIVGTPDAVAANDKAVSKRKATAEQPVATGAIPT